MPVPSFMLVINAQNSLSIHNLDIFQPWRGVALFAFIGMAAFWGIYCQLKISSGSKAAPFIMDRRPVVLSIMTLAGAFQANRMFDGHWMNGELVELDVPRSRWALAVLDRS